MPDPVKVKIVEMGPRDGLQNEKQVIPTAIKLELIERLALAGLKNIEATAFVSPKWVPQMGDHADIMRGLKRHAGVAYPVLTPNIKGYEAAVQGGATEVAVFASASEKFAMTNTNCSIAESFERFAPVFKAAQNDGVKVRGYVSCTVGCPMEGHVEPAKVADVTRHLYDMGCYEVSLADTIGVGTPAQVLPMLESVVKYVPVQALAGHFHDTYGTALMNIYAAYQFGLRVFDSSVSGLGGCPYARGATGNVATENVVYLMNGMGVSTGVDLDQLMDVSIWISGVLQRQPNSTVTRAVLAKRPQSASSATA